jgi:hypothetical protein
MSCTVVLVCGSEGSVGWFPKPYSKMDLKNVSLINLHTIPHNDITIPHNDITISHNDITIPHNDITIPHNDITITHNDITIPHNDKAKTGF